MPLVPTRSKSGGLRLWLFMDHGAAAMDVQATLRLYARWLALKRFEVFPKQTVLHSGDTGSAINVPYFNSDFGGKLMMQVGLKKTGAEMELSEFLRHAEAAKVTAEQLNNLLAARTPERAEDDAQHMPGEQQLPSSPTCAPTPVALSATTISPGMSGPRAAWRCGRRSRTESGLRTLRAVLAKNRQIQWRQDAGNGASFTGRRRRASGWINLSVGGRGEPDAARRLRRQRIH